MTDDCFDPKDDENEIEVDGLFSLSIGPCGICGKPGQTMNKCLYAPAPEKGPNRIKYVGSEKRCEKHWHGSTFILPDGSRAALS